MDELLSFGTLGYDAGGPVGNPVETVGTAGLFVVALGDFHVAPEEGDAGGQGDVVVVGTPVANMVYPKFRVALLTGVIPENLATADLVAVLAGSAYVVDPVNDEFLADVDAGDRVATSAVMAGKTFTGGAFDADDALFTAIAPGAECDHLLTVLDTGDAATSVLMSYAVGVGYTPSGMTPKAVWDARGVWTLAAGDDGTNVIYPKMLEALCAKTFTGGLPAQDLKLALCTDGGYTYSASHQYMSSVTRIADSDAVTGTRVEAGGVLRADAVRFESVTGGDVTKAVLYVDSGTDATSAVVAYYELPTAYTPRGMPVLMNWSESGALELTELA